MKKITLSSAFVLSVTLAATAAAQNDGLRPRSSTPAASTPRALQQVAFEQRLNEQLPLDVPFLDEEARRVTIGDYFNHGRPVVLAFVYYECPMLCTQVLNGLTSALEVIEPTIGRDFDVVTVSFDPRETPTLAAGKKKTYLDRYKREGAANGWHFLTGEESSIKALTDAAGFHYAWDESTAQFAHASGVVVATPDGRLSRYFFGIEYAPRDVKFALMESSAGKIGSLADQLLLYCYHYDPAQGSYSFVALNAVRLGGAVTVVALVGFVVVAIRRDTRAGH